MLGAGGVGGKISEVHLGLVGGGELNLGLLSGFSDSLESELVVGDIHAVLVVELLDKELLEAVVEVLTSEGSVTVSGLDLEDTSCDFENGNIESSTTKIVHGDDLSVSLIETEGEGSGGRLVNDSLHLEVSDLSGILSGLSLRVVEVGGHSNNGLLDGVSNVRLSGLLHLHEHVGADLLRRVLLSLSLNPGVTVAGSDDLVGEGLEILLGSFIIESTPDQTLAREDRVLGVSDSLSLGGDSNESLGVVGEGNSRRSGSLAFGILDDLGVAALHDGNTRVGGSQIDSDDGREVSLGGQNRSSVLFLKK
mmetsp:Transcript_58/g.35  ORF Transcript_58/g.35 Transcript_58/m.35 type:complete len:307 (+) Transcript_58:998-1918(+)